MLKEGESDLIVEIDEENKSMRVDTRDQTIARIQKRLSKYAPKRVLSEELLAERRKESRRG